VASGEESREGRGLEASVGEVAGGTQQARVMPWSKRETQGMPLGTLARECHGAGFHAGKDPRPHVLR
jgi:hypothetical protein